jgi:glycerophosphoryl diester phosphodiesterase
VRRLSLLCISILTLGLQSFGVEIIGHRGASFDAPENTMAAFRLGYEQGADGVELDIHLTKDNRMVVMHDYDTARVGGSTNKIAQSTLAELREYEIGHWGKWTNANFHEKIPLLSEVLAIITFNYDSAIAAKKTLPQLKTYWLVGYAKDKATGKFPDLDETIAKAKAAHVDGLDLNVNWPLTKENIARIKRAGLECHVWTVDDPTKAKELADAGVDSITTNRPKSLREQLR